MNSFIGRFIFAFILAAAAAALNYVWMLQKAPSESYVIFKKSVAQGETITEDMLGEIKLPLKWSESSSKIKIYTQTLLPWNARLSLIDLKAVRPFEKGELVQQVDIGAIDILPEYDILGPFRLIAVGGRFAQKYESDETSDSSSTITIAVQYEGNDSKSLDEKTRRLIQIVEKEKKQRSNSDNNDRTDLRLVGIVAWSGEPTTLPTSLPNEKQKPSLGLAANELAFVVPLPNLDTIPEVLLREDSPQIGFMVPATVVRSLDKIKPQETDSEDSEEQ